MFLGYFLGAPFTLAP